VREMNKKIGLTAIGLTLVLSLIGAIDAGAAFATDSEGTTPSTVPATTVAPVPTTSEAPPTTAAPAPAPAEESATTTTVAPGDSAAEPAPATEPAARRRWGPDPRWVDYGNCGRGYTACHVAKRHQAQGRFQWRNGHYFRWGTDRVRGHRGETWSAYRQEARQVRMYLYALAVARHRRALVSRWSGVANCESGGNWSIATGNGYYGGLQFNMGTWEAYGGRGMPHQQPAWYQATIADRVRTQGQGLGAWPHCGAYYG
jgi:Transglycosylase-like domain